MSVFKVVLDIRCSNDYRIWIPPQRLIWNEPTLDLVHLKPMYTPDPELELFTGFFASFFVRITA